MDPNRRCTCGYRTFRSTRTPEESSVQRWMQYDDSALEGGLGSAPLGELLGDGEGSGSTGWGLFVGTYQATSEVVACESCQRVRSSKLLGGITPMGSYISNGLLYVAAADVARPTTCYQLRIDGTSRSYTVPFVRATGSPPPLLVDTSPLETAGSPPAGAEVVDTLLCAVLPEVTETEEYTATLIDRCAESETILGTFDLEIPPMIIVPQDADLGGYPRAWLAMQRSGPTQVASRSRLGLPLEYCEEVLEYDARFGTLPSSQGWTHTTSLAGSPGDFQLVEGGALRILGPGGGDDTYWEATVALGSAPTQVAAYAHYLIDSTALTPTAGEGLSFQALIGANAASYEGVRWEGRDTELRVTRLDAASDAAWAEGTHSPRGWHSSAFERESGVAQGLHDESFDDSLTWGTLAGPAPQDEMVARFGDVAGNGMTAYIRNFVASTPGRFLRGWFTAYASVSAPRLRLYMVSDLPATVGRTIRVKIRYGSGTGAPYAAPATETDVTITLTAANTVYTTAIDLPGLSANAPFWFTVERDWSHADDTLQATAWLFQATVRSQ